MEIALESHDEKDNCEHYKRGCKILAPCCDKLFHCRLCHDEQSDHEINRFEIKKVQCKKCYYLQDVKQFCEICNNCMGEYFCSICNFFDDTDKGQFHCESCGICRVGGRENFYHCNRCNSCIRIEIKDSHNCIENVTKDVCPICRLDLFNSTESLSVLKCGHYMHQNCMNFMLNQKKLSLTSLRCPTCQKTIVDLSKHWAMMDLEIENVPMPEEYINETRNIICNDCETEGNVKFHVLGLKCVNSNCGSYNTKIV